MEFHYVSLIGESRGLEILLCLLLIGFLRRLSPDRRSDVKPR